MSAAPSSMMTLPVLQRRPIESEPASKPFHIIAKPTGAICNIDCEYCFYLDKEFLYERGHDFKMKLDTLETYVRQYIESQPEGTLEVNFAWQGGEPTLLGVDFFRKAVEFQQKYTRKGMSISNAFQTNGILLDDEWGRFLHENEFLVGLSVDGPEHLHNRYRVDKGGQGTFKRVMRGLEALQRNNVEYNTLTVVQASNCEHPEEVYDFLISIGSTYQQFIPIVEVLGPEQVSERSVPAKKWGSFLNGIFDRWVAQNHIGKIFLQHFDMMLGIAVGHGSSLCVHSETCGRAMAVEHNGDLFSCDHFVNWEDQLGNITELPISEMVDGPKQTEFGLNKRDLLPKMCRECEYLNYCWGGCPAHRNIKTPDGEPGLNFLCQGYMRFYSHTIPYFKAMAECLRRQRPASEFKRFMKGSRFKMSQKVDRNALCPCGSGKKYKKCCGR